MTREISRDQIQWFSPEEPRKQKPFILDPKKGQRVRAILLGGTLVGVEVHFYQGRTRPCIGWQNECPGCLCEGCRRDRHWYLAAVTPRQHRLCLAKITPHALETCPALEIANDLRAKLITLERGTSTFTSPVSASLSSPKVDVDSLPIAFDVQTALTYIWESERRI